VTRALSGGEDPEVDVVEIGPARGSAMLLCSDGLFAVVPDERAAAILADREAPLEEICGRLIAAANAAAGPTTSRCSCSTSRIDVVTSPARPLSRPDSEPRRA
jgi:PPM family protein phosphatase